MAVGSCHPREGSQGASSWPLGPQFPHNPTAGLSSIRPCRHGAPHCRAQRPPTQGPAPPPGVPAPSSQHPDILGPWPSGLLWQCRPGPSSAPDRPPGTWLRAMTLKCPAQSCLPPVSGWTPPAPPSQPPCSSATPSPASQPWPGPGRILPTGLSSWGTLPPFSTTVLSPSPQASAPMDAAPTRRPGRTTSSEPATH